MVFWWMGRLSPLHSTEDVQTQEGGVLMPHWDPHQNNICSSVLQLAGQALSSMNVLTNAHRSVDTACAPALFGVSVDQRQYRFPSTLGYWLEK